MNDTFLIRDLQVEYQIMPRDLDCEKPRFSWKLSANAKGGVVYQSAYQLRVMDMDHHKIVWDSQRVESDCSSGVTYAGMPLEPCTRYTVDAIVWNQDGQRDEMRTCFETGFMNPSAEAWHGAKWIGAPEKYFCTKTMGVFVLESRFTLLEGTQAGLVFGANDERLMDARKNQYEIAGENYIRYVVDISEIPAKLIIYRVGYAPEDKADKPLAVVPIVDYDSEAHEPVIIEENCRAQHEIKIEVIGDCAFTYVDSILVDAIEKEGFFGKMITPRQLNPLGENDTTTFPRLCDFGVYVGAGTKADFESVTVRFLRTPGNVVTTLAPGIISGCDKGGKACEVTRVENPSKHSIPMLRRNFNIKNEGIASARLYITARGIYDCRINGQAVTDTYLNPGMSQYDKHIMYQTWDVTSLIASGENGIGITLASGWWCDAQTYVQRNYNYFGDKEAVLACLMIKYEDGTLDTIVTEPETWDYYGEGPYTYAGMFQGEHLDGRRLDIYEHFSDPDFAIEGMGKAVEIIPEDIGGYESMPGFGSPWPEVKHGDTQIIGGMNAPVYEVCTLKAKSVTEPRKGLYIYDLEQEIAGVPKIKFHGKAGTCVTLRYGEMLYPKLPEYGNLHGMMLTENYRDAESIDHYILRGDPEGEIYCPKFTSHGYRYIEITGIDTPPALDEVESIQLSSVKKITGEIKTSNPLVNRFIENVRWSQYCNFISIPTDCPQRNERMGWAGDTHVFCRTATYQSDVRMFYYRYLQALKDLQDKNGKLPDIAPVGGGFGGITYESAMIFMTWELYQQYGDVSVIETYYDAMKLWMQYMQQKGMPGDVFVGPLGDWLAPEETDNALLWNAFYGRDAQLMAKMAKIIGRDSDAAEFAAIEKATKDYWNKTFVDSVTGKTKGLDGKINDTQCSYALPIAYGLFFDENLEKAYAHLARKTKEVDCTVSTGFFGTGVLNPSLTAGGHTDLAYALIQQTAFPSWLYPVTQGATTIWERWNSYTVENGFGGNNNMNSFNHYSLGSVVSWLYETVLGIRRDEEHPGYKHFTLAPAMDAEGAFEYAGGGINTPYGRIESHWAKTENGWHYTCEIPGNTTATLILPDGTNKVLDNGKYEFDI